MFLTKTAVKQTAVENLNYLDILNLFPIFLNHHISDIKNIIAGRYKAENSGNNCKIKRETKNRIENA